MFYVLKSSDVLDVLVPILYFLNDARADQCKNFMYFKFKFYRFMGTKFRVFS